MQLRSFYNIRISAFRSSFQSSSSIKTNSVQRILPEIGKTIATPEPFFRSKNAIKASFVY
ncbi:hypothetical protein C7B82_12080 [Stenomitos frigidus ULC18]|uniref:Uncharacterized protein n=1 Tax=Stenomitos frigidus ULC18 TaxID=2107698 RepID=A0A2T1E9B6_9CYAN|nr:hypothetical protein C7B82_12080 [Stenomitos frigidus ULC18]